MINAPSDKKALKIWWNKLTLFTYFIASLFMILFSVSAVQDWVAPWNHISIFIACLLPIFFLFFGKTQDGLINFLLSPEFLFFISILFLGTLNIIFSNNRNMSLHGMGLFLMSGLFSFISTRLLCDSLPEESSLTKLNWSNWT